MSKTSKAYREAAEKVDRTQLYSPLEAAKLARKITATRPFADYVAWARVMLITRGMSSGRLSKTVSRPSSSDSVVTRPAGLW